jgi:TolA-binding protein
MSADLNESPVPLAEISQGPNAFEAFLDRNQKGIVVFAILLAIAAVGAVIYRGIETSHQQSAGAALTKAEDLTAFKAVVDGQAGTTAAGSASVLLANSQWLAGKHDEAIATLQKFIAASPRHPAIPSAKANLGSKLMAQGKSGDAVKIFSDLASDPEARFIAPFALICLGDISKAAGDLDKAETSYTKAKTDFPESSFAETANRRLATLKTKPPVEIEPPPLAAAAATPADPLAALKASLPPGATVTPSAPESDSKGETPEIPKP